MNKEKNIVKLVALNIYDNEFTYLECPKPIYKIYTEDNIIEKTTNKKRTNDNGILKVFDNPNSMPYTRVLLNNGQYGFIDNDGILQNICFDIASDYNELGYAMVGLMGKTTWLDSNFRYLSIKNLSFVPFKHKDYLLDIHGRKEFDGFNEIEEFKKTFDSSDNLSKITYHDDTSCSCVFLSAKDNALVVFDYLSIDNEINKSNIRFKDSNFLTPFNKDGISFNVRNGNVIYDNGKYFTSYELVNYLYKTDFLDKKLKLTK